MPTLTATGYNTEGYVLVVADWTDTPSVQYATVTRRNTVTGETVTLRPHLAFDSSGNQLLNCGIGIWWDTEPPLNVPLEYCTTAPDVLVTLNANPGFETGTFPWFAEGGTLTQSALNPHSGSFSGLLTSAGAATRTAIDDLSSSYVLRGGVETVISAWVLAPAGWNGIEIYFAWIDVNGFAWQEYSNIEILDDNEYRYIEHRFTPPADSVTTELTLFALGNPPNASLFYFDDIKVQQSQAVTATACDTVTVTSDSLYLKNPLHPCLDQRIDLCDPMYDDCADDTARISYAGMADDEYDANTVTLYPVNRRRPIPVNRVRRDASSALTLITHDCAAKDAVKAINEPGDPLLFQDGSGDYCIEDRYMSVGTVGIRHIGVDQRDEFRLITMPYVVVDRPEGPADGPCGTRFEDLCDLYTTWGAIEISDLDWIDLPTGGASNDSPGGGGNPPVGRVWDDVNAEFANWTAVLAAGTRDWDELRDGL